MQEKLNETLENILGLLLLAGSYEIREDADGFFVSIETQDAGRLIGFRGESLEALQFVINQIVNKEAPEFKKIVLDVASWRKQKEEELTTKATNMAAQVIESGQSMKFEPMSSWQRRVIHTVIGEIEGVESESVGEGRDRHIIIRPTSLVKLKDQSKNVK